MLRSLFVVLIVLLACFFPGAAATQDVKILDSINKLLQKAKGDTSEVYWLQDYGGQYAYSNYDSAEHYYRKSKALATRINFNRGIQRYINYQSELYNFKGLFDSSRMICMGGIELARKTGDRYFTGVHLNNIGNSFLYQGINDSAAHYYLQVPAYFDNEADGKFLGMMYINLGVVFSNLGQSAAAIQYSRLSFALARKYNDLVGVGYALVNIGSELKKMKQYDSARVYLLQAYNIARNNPDRNLERDALVNLGFVETALAHYSSAQDYFQRSVQLSDIQQSDYGKITAYAGIAEILIKTTKYAAARSVISKALALALKGGFREEEKNLYMKQYETELADGKPAAALTYFRKYSQLKDSLSNVTIQNNIASLDKKYQAERKERLLLQKDLQINSQTVLLENKNAWIIVLSALALLMLVLSFVVWKYFRQRQIVTRRESELRQWQYSLQAREEERNRIAGELHDDIGATLSSIHIYSSVAEKALLENPGKVKGILQQINRNTRQVMENMSDIVWAMKQEHPGEKSFSNRIKNYGYDLLTSKNIECNYQIDEKAENKLQHLEARKNILLIVKEAMNNISKYSEATKAEVKMVLDGESMLIYIGDNGKGFNLLESKKGNGLNNMKRRTEHLGGIFTLQSLPDKGTGIQVSIPLTTISDKLIAK